MPLTEDDVFAALRRTWQPVATGADLAPGAVSGAMLLETELVLARFADGRVLAADVACPHKGARLSSGCIRDGELIAVLDLDSPLTGRFTKEDEAGCIRLGEIIARAL